MPTTPAAPPTILEPVTPHAPSTPVAIDAWRWRDCLGFNAYRELVLQREAARAEQMRAAS